VVAKRLAAKRDPNADVAWVNRSCPFARSVASPVATFQRYTNSFH